MKKTLLIVTIICLNVCLSLGNKITKKDKIKIDKLIIVNTLTGKTIKIGQKEKVLEGFDQLLKKELLDITIESEDFYQKFEFMHLTVFCDSFDEISSFVIHSNKLIIKIDGTRSFSVGDSIDVIENLFPNISSNRSIIFDYFENKEYLSIHIQPEGFDIKSKKYVDMDCSLILRFNPKSKILEEVLYKPNP